MTFDCDGQILQIFEEFFVIGNRKNDGSAFAAAPQLCLALHQAFRIRLEPNFTFMSPLLIKISKDFATLWTTIAPAPCVREEIARALG